MALSGKQRVDRLIPQIAGGPRGSFRYCRIMLPRRPELRCCTSLRVARDPAGIASLSGRRPRIGDFASKWTEQHAPDSVNRTAKPHSLPETSPRAPSSSLSLIPPESVAESLVGRRVAIDTGMALPINWPPKGTLSPPKTLHAVTVRKGYCPGGFVVVRIAVECLRFTRQTSCEKEF
jgi:hypothetical protein